jgi:DNA-directed RNA polymerase subunit delta
MEDIKMTKSRIDIAFDIVKENGEPIEFLSLWEKVCEALGEDPSSKVGKIGKLYTDLLEDGRFVNRPNNTWDLKEKYTFDEVKKPDMDFYSDDEEELDDVEEIKEIREEEKALFDEEDEEDEESLELDSNDDEEEKQSSEEDY